MSDPEPRGYTRRHPALTILMVAVGIIKREGSLTVFHCGNEFAEMYEGDLHRESGVGDMLSDPRKLLGGLACRSQCGSDQVKRPEPPEHLRDFRRFAQLTAQFSCSRVGASDIGSRIAFRRNQRDAQRNMQSEFLSGPFSSVRQSLD